MASTNQSPQYQKAESKFLGAQTDEERITYLEEMIKECPKHKSSEKMLANLKTRYKKLREKLERVKKSGKSGKAGIRKEDMQAAIVGFTNTGKSSLLSLLTNAKPVIAEHKFTTKFPVVGMMNFFGAGIQLIEVPALESEYYDRGIVNTADTILIIINDLKDITKIEKELTKANGRRIMIFNTFNQDGEQLRKIDATLKSKKYDALIIDIKKNENLEELKNKLFKSFNKIRVYTKEPRKEKSSKPMILNQESTIETIAKKLLKNLSSLKETKIWGPSSKFPGQIVGLHHELKDLDVVEFRTR